MLLLRQIDEGLGISRSLAGCFRDLRNPLLIEHSVRELVAQRLLGLAAQLRSLMIIIFCGSIPSLPWWWVRGILLPLGVPRRIKARLWPALRPSTGSNLVTDQKFPLPQNQRQP